MFINLDFWNPSNVYCTSQNMKRMKVVGSKGRRTKIIGFRSLKNNNQCGIGCWCLLLYLTTTRSMAGKKLWLKGSDLRELVPDLFSLFLFLSKDIFFFFSPYKYMHKVLRMQVKWILNKRFYKPYWYWINWIFNPIR